MRLFFVYAIYLVMELLELLEKRIDALLAEIEKLRADNSTLRLENEEKDGKIEELNLYIDTLHEEQKKADEVRERLEVLMLKIEDVLTK